MGPLDKLPRELFEAILLNCVYGMAKTDITQMRLVQKDWDSFLRPYACMTLSLDFTRLSRSSRNLLPDMYALDFIAPVCKNLSIDLRPVRDVGEFHVFPSFKE